MKLYTANEVAEMLGCHVYSVRRAASKHGIGRKIGWAWAFSAQDLARLRKVIHQEPGNPEWRAKKKGRQ